MVEEKFTSKLCLMPIALNSLGYMNVLKLTPSFLKWMNPTGYLSNLNFIRKMNAAKISNRSAVEWHDVGECSRCRELRDRDGISEREAVVRTIRGELPVLDDDAYATLARADEVLDGDADLTPEVTL